MLKKTRREINGIHDAIYNLRKDINDIPRVVECETCGCVLIKENATKRKGIIKIRKVQRPSCFYLATGSPVFDDEEYLYTPYYCKSHIPAENIK